LRLLARAGGAVPEELAEGLDRAHRLARTGLQESRQAITALRGETVPGPQSVADLVADHRAVSGRACVLVQRGRQRPLPADAALTLYRTASQECAGRCI
jgi:signal transduction histidine kinase